VRTRQRAAEAQEHPLLSKHYPIERRHPDVIPPTLAKPANFRRKSNVLSVAVCALVIPGLLATVALPAYGAVASPSGASSANTQPTVADGAQELSIAATAKAAVVQAPESFGVIAPVARRASGASLRALLANPPYPNFNLAAVPSVAARYLGVPYQLGGESPAGFDCSGLVAYVYAQFGIALPHSAAAQGRIGRAIARSAALPGDVVVMDGGSHVGIYLGGNRMLDAPEPGRVVTERAIYDNSYYIVRFGI
jgi:cell wall-associated NlpC family hydrolase